MKLRDGERVILNEGKIGWRKTLALTNKRLLFLTKDEINDEIELQEISEVYPNTRMLTNFTEMKIKLKNGGERSVLFKAGDMGLLLGGIDYAEQNARTMADRYINEINRALNAQPSVPVTGGRKFCRY